MQLGSGCRHQKEIPITLREVIDLIEKYYAALLGTLYPNLTDEMFAGLVELSATSKKEKIIEKPPIGGCLISISLLSLLERLSQ